MLPIDGQVTALSPVLPRTRPKVRCSAQPPAGLPCSDNIFVMRKRLLDRTGMGGDELDKQLGIQGLDYLD